MEPSRHNHRKFRLMRWNSDRSFELSPYGSCSSCPSRSVRFVLPHSAYHCFCSFSSNASYLQNLILAAAVNFVLSRSFSSHSLLRSSPRPISIDKLTHHCVYTVNLSTLLSARGLTSLCCGILLLEGGFTLRCLQRLSRPYFASLLCPWQNNWCTSGTSIPVLSY